MTDSTTPTYRDDIEAQRWCRYVPKHERPVLGALIKACLNGGNTVSVFDSEEYVVKRSTSYNLIKSQLGHAEEDQLLVRDSSGEKIGWFYLIYNNGSEGDPMVVISDYSDNEFCDEISVALSRRYDA